MFRNPHRELRSSFVFLFTVGGLCAAPALAQSTTRLSVDATGGELPNGAAWAEISGDGRYAAFVSDAPGIVPGDTNGTTDVFVRDLATGVVQRASITATGVEPNNQCFEPKLSEDGRYVAFSSWATNLAATDANGVDTDIFVKDLQTGVLEHVSVNNQGQGGNGISVGHDLSGNGRYVTFLSYATNLVANDGNNTTDTFLFDRVTRRIECLSLDPTASRTTYGGECSISFDGNIVAFEASPEVIGLPFVGTAIVLHDRIAGTFVAVNRNTQGQIRHATQPLVSADGGTVVFHSRFSFDPADADFVEDAFAFDAASGRIELVTPPPAGDPTNADFARAASISTTGRFVSFFTRASYDALDTNDVYDAFVLDRPAGTVERLSVGDGGQTGDDVSGVSVLSGNGSRAVFVSTATNLVPNDTNQSIDVFLRERCAAASTQLYGQGLAGTGGVVPGIALLGLPQLGSAPILAVANNTGSSTVGVLFLGERSTNVPTPLLGSLLVQPTVTSVLPVPQPALTLSLPIPSEFDLCGTSVFLQALLLDAGAPRSVSFTRGLEATIGS